MSEDRAVEADHPVTAYATSGQDTAIDAGGSVVDGGVDMSPFHSYSCQQVRAYSHAF